MSAAHHYPFQPAASLLTADEDGPVSLIVVGDGDGGFRD